MASSTWWTPSCCLTNSHFFSETIIELEGNGRPRSAARSVCELNSNVYVSGQQWYSEMSMMEQKWESP